MLSAEATKSLIQEKQRNSIKVKHKSGHSKVRCFFFIKTPNKYTNGYFIIY